MIRFFLLILSLSILGRPTLLVSTDCVESVSEASEIDEEDEIILTHLSPIPPKISVEFTWNTDIHDHSTEILNSIFRPPIMS